MKHIFSYIIAMLLPISASAQVSDLPKKVYIHQKNQHSTAIYNSQYVDQIGIFHRPVASEVLKGRNDSIRMTLTNGKFVDYYLASVDSITYYAPDSLMRANLAYQDARPTTFYPTYSDDYRNISSWSQRSNWQLANVHDPTVMLASDGYYYMSQTDAGFGNPQAGKGHFYVRRSKDLVKWEPVTTYNNSCILPEETPTWLLDSVNAVRERRGVAKLTSLSGLGYWAPCMRKVNDNLYRCYYSIVVGNCIKTGSADFDGSWNESAWIGMAETTDPASGIWVDKGGVLCSASDKGKDAYARSSESDYNAYARFNAIDPSFIITPEGEHWLIYGSWHSGIAAIQLDPVTGKTLNPIGNPWNIGTGQTTSYGKLIYSRNKSSRWQASEGAEVVYNPETGYYYLFLAYDGLDVPYNTRVVRSKNVNGPYSGKNGTNVTTNGGDAFPVLTHPYQFSSNLEHDGWVGISHCAVWNDEKGNWFFGSQGRKPTDYSVNTDWVPNAIMMGHVRRIYWTSDGWPVVSPERYAGVEDAPISINDLVGTWEFIDMTYSYGKQKMPVETTISLVPGVSNRVSIQGAFKGNAQFNSETNILQLNVSGTTFYFNVARELDWESSPRKSTIVMAGYKSATQTYWAKRIRD